MQHQGISPNHAEKVFLRDFLVVECFFSSPRGKNRRLFANYVHCNSSYNVASIYVNEAQLSRQNARLFVFFPPLSNSFYRREFETHRRHYHRNRVSIRCVLASYHKTVQQKYLLTKFHLACSFRLQQKVRKCLKTNSKFFKTKT